MDVQAQVEQMLELLSANGLSVRFEHLGGSGGGLCGLKGKPVMFVDLDADPATTSERCVAALATLPNVNELHLPPVIRERIEELQAANLPPH
jgi:hypothetical protein